MIIVEILFTIKKNTKIDSTNHPKEYIDDIFRIKTSGNNKTTPTLTPTLL